MRRIAILNLYEKIPKKTNINKLKFILNNLAGLKHESEEV